jgi:hypothetical protein
VSAAGVWARLRAWSPPVSLPQRGATPWAVDARGRPWSPAAAARVEALSQRHDLGRVRALCGPVARAESLWALDVLDRWLPPWSPADAAHPRGLDVGAKNGSYLAGLAAAWPHGWDLVELDAHRRYLDGTTRRAHGEAMAASHPGCRYLAGDVRESQALHARITWFLPFLAPETHRAWGLPIGDFAPEALLRHVLGRLAPGGTLLVVNQGPDEAEAQGVLLERVLGRRGATPSRPPPGVSVEPLGVLESPLSPYRHARIGWRIRREG